MQKIRSGQSFLYRKEGLNCTVIDVSITRKVSGAILNRALLKALERYPYLVSKLVEKDGDFYIADNHVHSMTVHRNRKLLPLGSMANTYHLMEVAYYGEHIYVSFHHGLCDGGGIKPFGERYEVGTYEDPQVIKDCFALPEYSDQMEDEDYRTEIEIDAGDYMTFAKKVNATPAILLSCLFSKAIYRCNPQLDKPIVCSMATDMRRELGILHTHKNCVRSMYLPFTAKDEIDDVLFDSMTVNSYVVSYLGKFELGECDSLVDGIHFYSGGIKGITINMAATGKKFCITFIQNIETEKYVSMFLDLLRENGIRYQAGERIRFSTTKDRTQKTAGHQAERFQIR